VLEAKACLSDPRQLHGAIDLIGLRAHATSVGLIQLCAELMKAGVLDGQAVQRIKDAIRREITISNPRSRTTVANTSDRLPHPGSTFCCNQRRRLHRHLSGRSAEEALTPSTRCWQRSRSARPWCSACRWWWRTSAARSAHPCPAAWRAEHDVPRIVVDCARDGRDGGKPCVCWGPHRRNSDAWLSGGQSSFAEGWLVSSDAVVCAGLANRSARGCSGVWTGPGLRSDRIPHGSVI